MRYAIELRKAIRYPLSAPASFLWAPHDGKPQNGQGITRDINTFGVYVETNDLPPVGARVQMEIVLPKLADSSPGMHLQGEGIVIRCDHRGTARTGFAASAQLYPETDDVVVSQLEAPGQFA